MSMTVLASTPRTDSQVEDVRRFFSGFAARWDSLYGGRRNLFWRAFDQILRRDVYERYQLTFDQLGPRLVGASVLDIGCGSGVYCFEAARRGASRVVGLDVADDMVTLARARCVGEPGSDLCAFVVGEFPPTPPIAELSSPFDHVIVMGVMDYVADAASFLTALRPLVRGSAVLSFPGRHWLRGPLRQHRYRLLGRCEVHNYEETTIRHLCTRAGFRHVGITRLNHSGICYIVTVTP
jgi:2-polyprenyl-3-methyl-5-hydroxy-6-metoxy-1,4-benzoquinol methylase